MFGVEPLETTRKLVIVLAVALEMGLPPIARDGHLHDLGRALVDRGDANVPLDLLDHVFLGVAVATMSLDRGVRGCVSRLRRQILGNGPLGIEAATAAVNALGGELDVGARGLESSRVRNDELVGVTLLLRERRATLDSFGGVRNRTVQRGPNPRPAQTPRP